MGPLGLAVPGPLGGGPSWISSPSLFLGLVLSPCSRSRLRHACMRPDAFLPALFVFDYAGYPPSLLLFAPRCMFLICVALSHLFPSDHLWRLMSPEVCFTFGLSAILLFSSILCVPNRSSSLRFHLKNVWGATARAD